MKKIVFMLMFLAIYANATLVAGGGSQAGAKEVNIRFCWWGSNERNARVNQILDLFESQHSGIKVSREYASFADYWTRFTTQAAAGTHPDVSLHVMQSVQEFVNKGVLIPLDDFVKSGRIDVSGWSGAAMSPGVINGKQYGIIYGLVAQGVIYNSKLIQDAGMPLPKDDWTYGEFRQYCMDLQMRLPANAFAVEAAATSDHALEIYMRSRGKSLYNSQGTGLGFDKQDLTDWWNLWEELRGARCIPDLMLAAELSGAPYEQTLFGTNRAAMIFQNANLIPTFQRLVNGEVGVVREPRYNRNIPGDFFQPTMYGISSKTNLVDQSVTFIDWMVNNMEANLIFKAEYGVPGNPRVVKALEDIATDVEKKNYQFSARIFADSTVPPSSARSEGSATVLDTLHRNAYEEAASKTISISAGVDKFFTEASALLARNRPNY